MPGTKRRTTSVVRVRIPTEIGIVEVQGRNAKEVQSLLRSARARLKKGTGRK